MLGFGGGPLTGFFLGEMPSVTFALTLIGEAGRDCATLAI